MIGISATLDRLGRYSFPLLEHTDAKCQCLGHAKAGRESTTTKSWKGKETAPTKSQTISQQNKVIIVEAVGDRQLQSFTQYQRDHHLM